MKLANILKLVKSLKFWKWKSKYCSAQKVCGMYQNFHKPALFSDDILIRILIKYLKYYWMYSGEVLKQLLFGQPDQIGRINLWNIVFPLKMSLGWLNSFSSSWSGWTTNMDICIFDVLVCHPHLSKISRKLCQVF